MALSSSEMCVQATKSAASVPSQIVSGGTRSPSHPGGTCWCSAAQGRLYYGTQRIGTNSAASKARQVLLALTHAQSASPQVDKALPARRGRELGYGTSIPPRGE